jgi:hypothetical protein
MPKDVERTEKATGGLNVVGKLSEFNDQLN